MRVKHQKPDMPETVSVSEIKVGETFLHQGDRYMRIEWGNQIRSVDPHGYTLPWDPQTRVIPTDDVWLAVPRRP